MFVQYLGWPLGKGYPVLIINPRGGQAGDEKGNGSLQSPLITEGPILRTVALKYTLFKFSLFITKMHFSTAACILQKKRERRALLFPSAPLSTSGALEVLKVLRNIGYLRVT